MPIDFNGIQTTGNRSYRADLISQIYDSLQYLPLKQRAEVLGTIIEESGGNPLAISKDGRFQGLLQWGADRYKVQSNDEQKELANQLSYLRSTLNNTKDHVSWTGGGKGSGFKSYRDAYNAFNSMTLPMDESYRGFSYGYVRPSGKEDSFNNRLDVINQVYKRIMNGNMPKHIEQPDATRVVKQILPVHRKDEGGYLNTPKQWDDLSLSNKSEIMRVAVSHGMRDLKDIRRAWNEFAEGGYIPSASIKKDIAGFEGSSMKTNRSFEAEAKDFNRVIPEAIRSKLSQQQLDALYSYGYNVGMGNLKERVLPTLTAYTMGRAGAEDVARSMWASKDPLMKGLQRRRSYERNMFIGNSPIDTQGSIVDRAINMDLSSLPSGNESINFDDFPPNPTDYGTPTDYSSLQTYNKGVDKTDNIDTIDESNDNGLGIFSLMQQAGLLGNDKQTMFASTQPIGNAPKQKALFTVGAPVHNDSLLDSSWFDKGGYLYEDGGDKYPTIFKTSDGYTTVGGHPVEQIGWDDNGYARYRDIITGDLGHAFEPSEAYTKTLVDVANLPKKEKELEQVSPEFDVIGLGGLTKGLTEMALDYAKKKAPVVEKVFKPLTFKDRNTLPRINDFGNVEDGTFVFNGFEDSPLKMHEQRALAKGLDTSDINIYDLSKDTPENTAFIEKLANLYGITPKQTRDYLMNHMNTHGHAAMFDGTKDIIYDGKGGNVTDALLSHEFDHVLHYPATPVPEGTFYPRLYNLYGNEFTKHNGTEVAARGSQLHDYFGHTGTEPLTEAELKYAREHYVKDTGINNDMDELLWSTKDFKKLADWMTNNSSMISFPIVLGSSTLYKTKKK